MAAIGSRLLQNWKLIFTIVLPLVLLPLLFIEYEDAAICKTASNHGPSNVVRTPIILLNFPAKKNSHDMDNTVNNLRKYHQ